MDAISPFSNINRSGLSGCVKWYCPTNSFNVFGRTRSANGADGGRVERVSSLENKSDIDMRNWVIE
jgi:hypothetical protein